LTLNYSFIRTEQPNSYSSSVIFNAHIDHVDDVSTSLSQPTTAFILPQPDNMQF